MKKGLTVIKIISLSFICLLMLIYIIMCSILHGRISSMMSVKKVGNGLYTMNYQENYHLDKALKAGIRSGEDLVNFLSDEIFFGYKIDYDNKKYGCSAFLTQSPDGDYLVGRNFDLLGSDTLALYTHPKGGYASISTISTDIVSVGNENGISPTSLKGEILLLASPYIAVDGMNEKGLSAALLDMMDGETHMDSEKPDLIVSLAIRLILDKTSTVSEAVELLKKYDIQTAHGCTQHIFIADKSGSSAIVEWYDNEMKVIDYNVCTNFRMSDPIYKDNDYIGACYRFNYIDISLKAKPINTMDESMNILEHVKQKGYGTNTIWSVVYNLSDYNADYVVKMNYDNIYHLKPRTDSKEGLIMSLTIILALFILGTSLFLIIFKKKKNTEINSNNESKDSYN